MVNLEIQTVINLVGGAVLTVVGWFARELYSSVKSMQKDIKDIEIHLPTSYVSKLDFNDTMKEIKEMVHKIFDKLDNKADK